MENPESLKESVREKYGRLAREGGSCCGGASCCEPAQGEAVVNISEDYSRVEGYVQDADLGLGCGIPTEAAGLLPGQVVLDLGSGAGNDVFVARRAVGEAGKVIGVDMTPDMIKKARENASRLGYANVEFRLGEIEHLPVEAGSVDRILSNCVLNLVPDKGRAFAEMYRVLKPGGRFGISDVVVEGAFPENLRRAAELYAGCVSGAMQKSEYLETLGAMGFEGIEIVKERPLHVPDDWLAAHADAAGREALHRSGVRMLSITLKGAKPAPQGEQSREACCTPLAAAGDGPCCLPLRS